MTNKGKDGKGAKKGNLNTIRVGSCEEKKRNLMRKRVIERQTDTHVHNYIGIDVLIVKDSER